jgi:4'-phosphopantetheinyl transferase
MPASPPVWGAESRPPSLPGDLVSGPTARGPFASLTAHPAARFTAGSTEILVACLDLAPDAVHNLAASLSDSERQRVNRLAFHRDRRRFIVARARLRQFLAARLGIRAESVELASGSHGKPELAQRFAGTGWRFNLSHSDDIAVYAFSRGCRVGIDVEALRAIHDADDIAASFFSRHENDVYRALVSHDKPLGFFNCWTRKEAFIKALGDGLSHSLDSFDVSLAPGEPAKILRVGKTCGDGTGWRLDSFSPAPGYIAAVVTECHRHRQRLDFQTARETFHSTALQD